MEREVKLREERTKTNITNTSMYKVSQAEKENQEKKSLSTNKEEVRRLDYTTSENSIVQK